MCATPIFRPGSRVQLIAGELASAHGIDFGYIVKVVTTDAPFWYVVDMDGEQSTYTFRENWLIPTLAQEIIDAFS